MDLNAYLFTINKNNSYRLDPDEMKDVLQDVKLYLSQKNYNNLLTKKSCQIFYKQAVIHKDRRDRAAKEKGYLETTGQDESSVEREEKRLNELGKLDLSETQKKIVKLLIAGFEYKEVRKKLKINPVNFRKQVQYIRQRNAGR